MLKMFKLDRKVDRERLMGNFEKYLPDSPADAEVGECYGRCDCEKFCIKMKKAPRSAAVLAFDELYGDVDRDGNLRYSFRRSAESKIMTLFAPALLIVFFLVGYFGLNIDASAVALILALPLFWCNLIKPKGLRADLVDCMMRVVGC